MPLRQGVRHAWAGSGPRLLVTGALSLVMLMGLPGTSLAVPPPPPNPSDSDLNSSRAAANARAGEVGRLTNQLAEAEQRLSQLQGNVELKLELANKALVDMQTAQDAASEAQFAAQSARTQSDAAAAAIEKARADVDKFIAGSYQQGSTIGSMSAYLGSNSPADLLARAQLLNSVGGGQLNALQGMQRAQTDRANKNSAARKALEIAQQKQAEAEQAKTNADAAKVSAQQAQQNQATQNSLLQATKTNVEQRLYAAQAKVTGLQGQRQRYEDWLAQKRRDEEAQARQAALAASQSSRPAGGGQAGQAPSPPAGAGVEAVIARGIPDGGVADLYGDYNKIGFDCSGLMVYAFAGVQALPHYSGYQFYAGRQVPISQMRRGDMLFYGDYSNIHHVTLYLGNGQLVEAQQSGTFVMISPVRYGGIMPYATRLVG
jgi:cell wall-associated NlpC family hydrolase